MATKDSAETSVALSYEPTKEQDPLGLELLSLLDSHYSTSFESISSSGLELAVSD